jgi:hypothetical protein
MRLVLCALLVLAAQDQKQPPRLTVHEWGTFTTVAGSSGASLEWRPLAQPSELPGFVYSTSSRAKGLRHGKPCPRCGCYVCDGTPDCKDWISKCEPSTVRMETPVLYFYTDTETKVSVKVGFPKGAVTEWYPQARWVGAGIDWGLIKIIPGATVEFPHEPGASHYYAARDTDAAPVQVCGKMKTEREKFLFYRGIGTFDLPMNVTQEKDGITVRNLKRDPISAAILFSNRDGRVAYCVEHNLTGAVSLKPKEGVAEGLFKKEARAMIETWRDSWFEPGTRVFYLLPRRSTDTILPITLAPSPSDLVRVMVGRVELITPEMEREILGYVEKLGDESFAVRESASHALARYGRFLEPVLKRLRSGVTDPEILDRIDRLLK